jgi:acyl-coenzyme A synthetase/AMP-(fatty) acid ligase
MTQDARLAIRSPRHTLTVDDLEADALGLRELVPGGSSVQLSTSDAAEVAAAFIALDGWAGEVLLVSPDASAHDDGPIDARVTAQAEPANESPQPTRWVLQTSGTTGEPKRIGHSLDSLSRGVRAEGGRDFIWGLLYDPNRMAGTQVLLQGLRSGAPIIAPSLHSPLAERLAMFVEAGVTAISASASQWRQILQAPNAREIPLRQITLGGEIADQLILDALRVAFPDARIVHVFAATETGTAFSVTDGLSGFPVSYLTDPPRGVELQIRDDILHVKAPGSSVADADGFVSTGDVVETVDDRVHFRGRASGIVNVGGTNVSPEAVETILREHPDVVEAVVTAKANALVGNTLVAKVTLTDGADREGVSKRLRAWVRERATPPLVPASVVAVDELTLTQAGKVAR